MNTYTRYDGSGLICGGADSLTGTEELLLACDVGGTTVKLGIFTLEDEPQLLCRTAVPTRTEENGRNILPDTAKAARALAEEHGLDFARITGAGVGVPGPVLIDENGDAIVNHGVNLNWGVVNVSREFSDLTGIPKVTSLNDANAAALGEFAAAGGISAAAGKSAVMVTLGTGVGGGVVCNGSILTGIFGSAGEIGHMPMSPYHPLLEAIREKDPSFPAKADLEYYASATGITRIAKAALKTSGTASVLRPPKALPEDPSEDAPQDPSGDAPEDIPPAQELTAKDIFDAAREGDALALSIADCYFDTLGCGLASIAAVIDPDLFLLGGGVSKAGQFLLEGVRSAYRENVFHSMRDTRIELAVLGGDAGLLGAIIPFVQ